MYRAIVAHRVRAAWRHLNDRDIDFVLAMLATSFTHRFVGENAMGGVRNSLDSQRRWFERLFRLLADIEFTVEDVLAGGWPWRTRVVALLTTKERPRECRSKTSSRRRSSFAGAGSPASTWSRTRRRCPRSSIASRRAGRGGSGPTDHGPAGARP